MTAEVRHMNEQNINLIHAEWRIGGTYIVVKLAAALHVYDGNSLEDMDERFLRRITCQTQSTSTTVNQQQCGHRTYRHQCSTLSTYM